MLDWIFEGIVNWISSIVSQMMDAVSGLFLQALGTDMTAMEEYFPPFYKTTLFPMIERSVLIFPFFLPKLPTLNLRLCAHCAKGQQL